MDFNFSDDHVSIKDLANQFARDEMLPHAETWDRNSTFPMDVLQKAAGLGFAAIYTGEKYGGTGLGRMEAAIIFEALSVACPSTAAFLSIHNMVSWIIDAYGSDALRETWLPQLIPMDKFASYCLTEPSSGSDAASLKTTAKKSGDEYILNGSKAFISGGSVSEVYAVMVRTGDDSAKGISCILVEKGTPGLSFGKKEEKLGWNSQPTSMVFFEDCKVPASNLIGREGDGFKIALSGLNGGRVNIGACSLGGARAALNYAKQYMHERQQFNKKLTQFQALQFKFADMITELDAARLMVYRAAHSLDQNSPHKIMHCAMAKRYATDVCFDVVNQALQLLGGYGYLMEYPIQRYFRDLRVHQILEGTNEIMRLIISRAALDETFEYE